jgi:2-hydroxy-6-oxonona-2,4-dienedioate hydrolase
VHGAIVSHIYFLPLAELLASRYQIIIPDLIGHGQSSKPAHVLPVVEQASMLHALLKTLSIDRVHLLANSYGCEIATEFAIRYPDCLDKLVLIGPATDPHQKNIYIQLARLFYDGVVERPKMSIVLMRDLCCMGMGRAIDTSKQMIAYDYRPRLPWIKAPTLIVRGKNDALAPQKWVEEAQSLVPDSRLEVVANAPHNVQFTTPGPLAQLVRQFFPV